MKLVKQSNTATVLHCNSATGNRKQQKPIKLVKQSNTATMLQCNSATGIKKQQNQLSYS